MQICIKILINEVCDNERNKCFFCFKFEQKPNVQFKQTKSTKILHIHTSLTTYQPSDKENDVSLGVLTSISDKYNNYVLC